jgi:hypothetical protein
MSRPRLLSEILGHGGSLFEDALPGMKVGESRDFLRIDEFGEAHHFRIAATDELGCDSGRRRYRVECLSCRSVVHEATTGPMWMMRGHLRDVADGVS